MTTTHTSIPTPRSSASNRRSTKQRAAVAIALFLLIPFLKPSPASAQDSIGPDVGVSHNNDRGKLQFRAKAYGKTAEIDVAVVYRNGPNRYLPMVTQKFRISNNRRYQTYTLRHKNYDGYHIAAIHVDVRTVDTGIELEHFKVDGKVVRHKGKTDGSKIEGTRVRCFNKTTPEDTLRHLAEKIPQESYRTLRSGDLSSTSCRTQDGKHTLAWQGRVYSFYKISQSPTYSVGKKYFPFERNFGFAPLLFQKASQEAYNPAKGQKAEIDGYETATIESEDKYKEKVSIFHRKNKWNNRRRCIVAFRGTANGADELNDFYAQFTSTRGLFPTDSNKFKYEMDDRSSNYYKRHGKILKSFSGFYDHLEILYKPIHDRLEDLKCQYLGLTGHSLGGVSAHYFALWTMFDENKGYDYSITDVVTFNAPRGTTLKGSQAIPEFVETHGRTESLELRWENYCRQGDPVRVLPTGISNYGRITMKTSNATNAQYRGCDVLAGRRDVEKYWQGQHDLEMWAAHELNLK